MKKNSLTPLITAAIAGSICSTAFAATWEGDALPDPAHTDWFNTENWDTGIVPGVGGAIGENVTFNGFPIAKLVDIGATSVSVGVFRPTGNHDDVLYSGTGTITATDLYLGTSGGNNQPDRQTFDANLVITNDIRVFRKNGGHVFNGSVTAGGLNFGQSTTTFNGPVTITGANGLEVFYSSIAFGGGPTYNLNDVLNAAGGEIVSSLGSVPARLTVGADDTLSGLTDVLDVNANGQLNFDVTPASPADFGTGSVAVNAGGLLLGDPGDATWGPSGDIDVKSDAVLALDGGATLPTTGEIGTAVAWQGVTGNGTWTAGDDGTSIFKGLALGGFSGTLTSKTLVAPLNAGDTEIIVLAGTANAQMVFNVESTDGTGVANFHVKANFNPKNGFRLNSDPAAGNQVTTFNMIGEVASPGSPIITIGNTNPTNSIVYSDQTYNFSGQGYAQMLTTNIKGALTFSDDTMYYSDGYQFENKLTVGYANTSLTLNDGTALSIADGQETILELLDPTQLSVNGTPNLVLRSSSGDVYEFAAGSTDNIISLMEASHVCIAAVNANTTMSLKGDGLSIGDGNYLIHRKGRNDRGTTIAQAATTSSTISAVPGGAGTTLGLASQVGNLFKFTIPIDGNQATILVNSTTDLEHVDGTNARNVATPARPVQFAGSITDTPLINILNGTAEFQSGVSVPAAVTIDTIGGDGTVSNPGNLTFSTVAPGASVGTIEMGDFILDGSTYECEISGAAAVAGTDNDVITGGTVTLGTWTLNLVSLGLNPGDLDSTEVFTIIDADNSIVDFNAGNVTITDAGLDTSSAVIRLNAGDDSIVEVTGLLVDAAPSSPYDTWASDNGLVGDDALPTADVENGGAGDGLDNLYEFGVGLDPNVSDNASLTVTSGTEFTPGNPIVEMTHNPFSIKMLYVRHKDPVTAGLTYTPKFSATGGTFIPDPADPTPSPESTQAGDYEVVSVPFLLFGPDGKKAASMLGQLEVALD